VQDGYTLEDGSYAYEQCDDGNMTSGDGCSATCLAEVGFYCALPGEPCHDVVCGDGNQETYVIANDGSGAPGSGGSFGAGGSSATGGSAGAGGSPYAVYAYEGCDDGNTTSGDGCDAGCEIETGYICDMPGAPCRQPTCGDGFVDYIPGTGGAGGSGGIGAGGEPTTGGTSGTAGTATAGAGGTGGSTYGTYEECDDANGTPGDGCSASCTLEPGYSCPEAGLPCKLAVCGDGIVDYPAEDCDDGSGEPSGYCVDCHYSFPGSGGTGAGGMFGGSGTGGSGGSAGSAGTAGSSSGSGGRFGGGFTMGSGGFSGG